MYKLEVLKNIYDDTASWLKFVETKLTAFLTFETGLFYFVAKLVKNDNKSLCFWLSGCGIFVSLLLLLMALLPKISNSDTPLYFMTWADGNYKLPDNYDGDSNIIAYESQIKALAKITKKKMTLLKWSMILYTVSIILFSVTAFL